MEVIDRHWISARLTGKRGELAALARAMGIDAHKISKVMSGKRKVSPEEIPGLLSFFGYEMPTNTQKSDLEKSLDDLPEHLHQEALQYIEYLKSRG